MRILFAEDEEDLNTIVKTKLESDGYVVDSCFDGEEAIDCFDMAEYDVVVLDIMMPVKDGYAVLEHIRNKGSRVPVLFLTARDSIDDRVQGLDSGANDYLVKPFSLDELSARVRALTRNVFGETKNVIGIADLEMHKFRKNKNSVFIRNGLWKYSRHPNYLGEITFWVGIALVYLLRVPAEWYYCLGCIAIYALFIFGSINLKMKSIKL